MVIIIILSFSFVLFDFFQESITVQMWDFAGQRDYYVTHKVFLSSSAIYLLVFDLRLQREGVSSLRPWLSDIQVSSVLGHSYLMYRWVMFWAMVIALTTWWCHASNFQQLAVGLTRWPVLKFGIFHWRHYFGTVVVDLPLKIWKHTFQAIIPTSRSVNILYSGHCSNALLRPLQNCMFN